VAAQVVYYFKGYFAATRGNAEAVDFAVPSGNFGNILAGHVAKRMGLPIRRLILATNENDVLDEFFRTLRYRPRGATETHATSSPSMDISKASNFERYVFDVVGRDPAVVRALWQRLATDGGFDLSGTPHAERVAASGFVSGRSTHADRVATIRDVAARFGVVVDPHTPTGSRSASNTATRGAARLHRDGAAGEVRGHDPRGARPRPRPSRRVCRPRVPAAALRAHGRGRRRAESIHRHPRCVTRGGVRSG
jgi:threonine synthase